MSCVVLNRGAPRQLTIVAALLTFAAAVDLAGCANPRPPFSPHDLAEQYARLALQFAQHRPNLVEGWRGPDAWKPGPRVPVDTLRASVSDLLEKAERLSAADVDATEAARVQYLRGQLRALAFIGRRLLGEAPPFAEEMEQTFGAPLPSVDDAALAAARQSLANELPGDGDLAQRLSDFRKTLIVREDRFDRSVAIAERWCRSGSSIALPKSERVESRVDAAQDWPAFARYRGDHQTTITFASRSGFDVATLLHTVCHEGIPGHHAQNVLVDDALVRGHGWAEFQLSPAFGPHVLIMEGAAEAATDLALADGRFEAALGELLTLNQLDSSAAAHLARVHLLATRLEAVLPSIIGRYLDNAATRDATVAALQHDALVGNPEQFLAFAERHRAQAVVYPIGKAVVSAYLAKSSDDHWRRLGQLFTLRPFSMN